MKSPRSTDSDLTKLPSICGLASAADGSRTSEYLLDWLDLETRETLRIRMVMDDALCGRLFAAGFCPVESNPSTQSGYGAPGALRDDGPSTSPGQPPTRIRSREAMAASGGRGEASSLGAPAPRARSIRRPV
jgi:hypothetical protein